MRYIEITLISLTLLIENIPALLCKKSEIVSIIENKLMKNLKFMLNASNVSIIIARNQTINLENSNILRLTIRLLYSVVTHIEFTENIKLNFLNIIINIFENPSLDDFTNKLEFIKDNIESIKKIFY
ncbi:hypothetical protein MXB_5431 [Myxobolus squamalis]|nr:hypothetical protein MXB_5431 [Myxobolus squamalis]